MKIRCVAVLLSILAGAAASADQSGVKFEVQLTRDGKIVSSPVVVGEFGKRVRVEIADIMKFEASATAPDSEGNSLTSVKLYLFENGEMQSLREMSMRANLSETPAIEYAVPGTNARFRVMPRRVTLPEVKG